MNGKNDNGGPAFPLDPKIGKSHFGNPEAYTAMTLLDYMAERLMVSLITQNTGTYAEDTRNAYEGAAALLAEKSRREGRA